MGEAEAKNCNRHRIGQKRWLRASYSTSWENAVQRLGRQVVEVGSEVELCDGKYVADSEIKAIELGAKYM